MRSIVKPRCKTARFSCDRKIYDIYFSQFLLHFTCGRVKLSTIAARAAKTEKRIAARAAKTETGIAARAAKTETGIAARAANNKTRIAVKAAKKEANDDPKSVCSRIPLL